MTQAGEMRDYCKTVREYVSQSAWESISSCFDKHVWMSYLFCLCFVGNCAAKQTGESQKGVLLNCPHNGEFIVLNPKYFFSQDNLIGKQILVCLQ
jgi:hypothetical protein